jgi:hypothetical protein
MVIAPGRLNHKNFMRSDHRPAPRRTRSAGRRRCHRARVTWRSRHFHDRSATVTWWPRVPARRLARLPDSRHLLRLDCANAGEGDPPCLIAREIRCRGSTRRDRSFPQVTHRGRSEQQRRAPAGGSRYNSRVVLMLAALGLALFGVIRLSQTLEPRQRVVLVFVFILGVAWVLMQLVRLGILGRVTTEP